MIRHVHKYQFPRGTRCTTEPRRQAHLDTIDLRLGVVEVEGEAMRDATVGRCSGPKPVDGNELVTVVRSQDAGHRLDGLEVLVVLRGAG